MRLWSSEFFKFAFPLFQLTSHLTTNEIHEIVSSQSQKAKEGSSGGVAHAVATDAFPVGFAGDRTQGYEILNDVITHIFELIYLS